MNAQELAMMLEKWPEEARPNEPMWEYEAIGCVLLSEGALTEEEAMIVDIDLATIAGINWLS